ncbi:MAG: hypothetical protein L0H73_04835 [Nitrococcus sp.]|nr:hypothetical protein [Nitrococcus sp.]
MDAAKLLQQVIDSSYRVATLKTQETDRLLGLFKRYSLMSGQAVYHWTAQSGLYRVGVEHILIPRTRTPADVLAYIAASRHYGIYLLQGFEPALAKPSIQKTVDGLCDADDAIQRLVLLIGEYWYIPTALQGRIATVRHNVRDPAAPKARIDNPLSRSSVNTRRHPVAHTIGPYLVTSAGNDTGR